VIDRQVALFMNQNLTTSAFVANREFGVTTTDTASVDQAQILFDRDWDHEPQDDPDGPLIVSPSNSRARYLDLIQGAEDTIDFYAEVIRDTEIVDALEVASIRGVAVRLIVDASFDEVTQEFAVQLHNGGAEIRLAETLYIHAKLMVIDGEIAIVGSQNFTSTSLDDNRELAIAIDDPILVERCLVIFDRDWLRAIPGSPT
jgi:phosphatidylserine/phosphatidylglycerophosphate/cardiolipin synthase-like enzyme